MRDTFALIRDDVKRLREFLEPSRAARLSDDVRSKVEFHLEALGQRVQWIEDQANTDRVVCRYCGQPLIMASVGVRDSGSVRIETMQSRCSNDHWTKIETTRRL